MSCAHPDCNHAPAHTYSDGNGNEIELCADHYFAAVYPTATAVSRQRQSGDDGAGGGGFGFGLFEPREERNR
jgi:hypothetical protein